MLSYVRDKVKGGLGAVESDDDGFKSHESRQTDNAESTVPSNEDRSAITRNTLWLQTIVADFLHPPPPPETEAEWKENATLFMETAVSGDPMVVWFLNKICDLEDTDARISFFSLMYTDFCGRSPGCQVDVLKTFNYHIQAVYNSVRSVSDFQCIRRFVYAMFKEILGQNNLSNKVIETLTNTLWFYNLFRWEETLEPSPHLHCKALQTLVAAFSKRGGIRNVITHRLVNCIWLATSILEIKASIKNVQGSAATAYSSHFLPTPSQLSSLKRFMRSNVCPADTSRVQMLERVRSFLEQELGLRIYVYGSLFTGLTSPFSDIDLTIKLSDLIDASEELQAMSQNTPEEQLHIKRVVLKWIRERLGDLDEVESGEWEVISLLDARTPIVKLAEKEGVDTKCKLSLDISITADLYGVRNSSLLKHYALLDSRLHALVAIIKQWSKRRHVNGAFNGYLSSFAYTLSIIHYLQCVSPPVLPNIQLPSEEDMELMKSLQEEDEIPTKLIAEMKAKETMCEDPDLFCAPNWEQMVWWSSWKSKNRMTVLELLHGYFEYMGFYFPHEERIISPRVAPEPLNKINFFVNSNLKLYPIEVPTKKKKKKKKKNNKDQKESETQPQPDTQATDYDCVPFEYTSLYRWKYCHTNHAVQKFVQDHPGTTQFHKLLIEDPVDNGRLLTPFRARALPQTILEFIRGFLILQSGMDLDTLLSSWLPLCEASLTLDMDRVKDTDYYHALLKRIKKQSLQADEFISGTRHEILKGFYDSVSRSDLLPDFDHDLIEPRGLADFWDKGRAERLVFAWQRAEDLFKVQLESRRPGCVSTSNMGD